MKRTDLKKCKRVLTCLMLVLCVNVFDVFSVYFTNTEESVEVETDNHWDENSNGRVLDKIIAIYYNSQYLTIQDSNPVNTITVRITHNDSGATVFENVYPKGQTSLIVIPLQGWSGGSYTIELFGRENNGYLWGTFQVLP